MDFTTPVGRLVQGDCFVGNDKDRKGQPYIIKTGPNKGNPTKKFYQGVAYPKVLANGLPNEEFNTFYRNVIEVARGAYPQFFTGPIDPFTGKPGCTHPRMALKIMDGDGVDENGVSNATKEGFAGHWIVKFGGSFAPRCFEIGKFAPEQVITEPSRIKRGYYVAVSGTCEPNIGSDVPGVYMNGNLICLVSAGLEIISGPDAGAAFGGLNTSTLPQGCVVGATPANAGGAVPPAPGAAVPVPPAPGVATPPPPVAHDPMTKALADGWVAHPSSPPHMYKGSDVKLVAEVLALYPAPVTTPPAPPAATVPPPPPAVPPAPPAATGVTLTPAGAALGSIETFLANGWTIETLKAGGYAV